jgi:transcriptional regulator with XRE-family HTH domain
MTENYELQLAEEKAVAHVQAMALRLLDAKNISRTELAERMGVSPARVSQLLGDEPENLSVKKAARLFHALGEPLSISCPGIDELNRLAEERNAFRTECFETAMTEFSWAIECANFNSNDCGFEPEQAAA